MSDDMQWLMGDESTGMQSGDDVRKDKAARMDHAAVEDDAEAREHQPRHAFGRSAFFVADPPREVPRSVRLAVLFGGGLSLAGWWVLVIGSLLGWFLVGNCDLLGPLRFSGKLERSKGRITAVEKTGHSEGGSKRRRGDPVYRYAFEFSDRAGMLHTGTSFRAGSPYDVGREVSVQYKAEDPAVARIQGMRSRPISAFAGIALIIPAVGAILAAFGFACGSRRCRLLTHGVPAEAVLKSKRATGGKVNKKQIYRCEFEFTDRDKLPRTIVVNTHQLEAITDEPRERLLYDPGDPRQAVLLDNLPGRPVIDEMGRVRAGPHTHASGAMLAPLLTVAANILGAFVMMS